MHDIDENALSHTWCSMLHGESEPWTASGELQDACPLIERGQTDEAVVCKNLAAAGNYFGLCR